ncbi:hypothetical protein DA469_22210 [Bacillus subtilis]|nr:hypothetical protein DA469_22210 [Bacillus subtilis]
MVLKKENHQCRCALRELEEEFGIKAGIQTYTVELVDYTDKFYLKRGQIKYKRDFTFITRLKRSTN